MPDRYTYPGTDVLINYLGITNAREWKSVETAAISQRMAELTLHPIEGEFDLAHLQAIHAHLVQDMYTWGGQLRDTDTGPGGTLLAHCRPQFIPAEADRIFGQLGRVHHLRDPDVVLRHVPSRWMTPGAPSPNWTRHCRTRWSAAEPAVEVQRPVGTILSECPRPATNQDPHEP